MRGQFYGMDGVQIPENTTANSGKYRIVELRPPEGYFLDAPEQAFEFVYQDGDTPVIELEHAFQNDGTSFYVSKRQLTGDDELPGATLTISDKDGNVVRQWVSGDKPARKFAGWPSSQVYTLSEQSAPDGYTPSRRASASSWCSARMKTAIFSTRPTSMFARARIG